MYKDNEYHIRRCRMARQVGVRTICKSIRTLLILGVLILSISTFATAAQKVTFIGKFTGWGPELEQAVKNFQAKTGIEVEVMVATSWPSLIEKVKTMTAAGLPPDLIYGDNLRIMELAELGLLAPLEEISAKNGVNLNNYPSMVLDGLRLKGKLYSLPTSVSIYATFYNVDLFDKAGIGYLPTKWTTNDLGWDEWVALASKLTIDTNGDGVPEQYGLGGFGSNGGFNMIGLWNASDVTEDRTKYLGTDPSVVRALEMTTSLWTEYGVVGGNFFNGNAAIYPSQSQQLNALQQRAEAGGLFNWSLGVLPKGDTRVAQTGFQSIGLSKFSSNSEAAFALAKYLAYEREGAILFTRAENRVPILAETSRDALQRWSAVFPNSNTSVLIDAIPVLWDWRVISGIGGSEILTLQAEAFKYIRNREKSVRDALEFIAPRIQAALQGS